MRRWDRLVEGYIEGYRARGINPATVAHTAAALDPALARNHITDSFTRAANDDCINGGSCTRTKYLYDGIAAVMDAATAFAMQTDMAGSLAQRSADARVLPGDIQELIAATAQCQGKLAFFASLLQIEKLGLDNAMPPAAD